MSHESGKDGNLRPLLLGALGVVFGDIGTSPLYSMSEAFHAAGHDPNEASVLGVLSLVVWTLILVVSVKYLAFVLRADNGGEGGILALMALVVPKPREGGFATRMFIMAGLFGAALLYGDGVITPAISVISAVEGVGQIAPGSEPYVIPITIGILAVLFSMQSRGTARVGALFGPVMVVWFAVLAVLGAVNIAARPSVLFAFWPGYGVTFLIEHGWAALPVLGGVFLVTTGGEALYADMAHFGKYPIRLAWFGLVFPALLINYFGQGALLMGDPHVHPFYGLAPKWLLGPLVVLATMATVIASQALISGAFSLTRQAVQLGYLPRIRVEHTSAEEIGQIYVPLVNRLLFVSCVALVVAFGSSTRLAAAYGIAVVSTMLLTSVLFAVYARQRLAWPWVAVVGVTTMFLVVEGGFLAANVEKIPHGGWFPLALGALLFTLMITWFDGRLLLWNHIRERSVPYETMVKRIRDDQPFRARRTAVFMTADADRIPQALYRNLVHNQVVHERVLLVTVHHEAVPRVPREEQLESVQALELGFWRVSLRFGFMDDPNVPRALALLKQHAIPWELEDCTFFLGRETVLATRLPGMALWREHLFALLTDNAQRATSYYELPPALVVEFGTQIEI